MCKSLEEDCANFCDTAFVVLESEHKGGGSEVRATHIKSTLLIRKRAGDWKQELLVS